MSSQGLKKGIAFVFIANLFNLCFNLISNFLLPKYLSVNTYADIKTFQLITSYLGILSFGYVDGIYLKYGGKDIRKIDNDQLGSGTSSFRLSQLAISLLCASIGLFFRNPVWTISGFAIVSLNMTGYIKSLYQATGEFGKYARATNMTSVLTFLANVVIVFILSYKESSILFLSIYLIIDCLVWLYLEIELIFLFHKKSSFFAFSIKNLLENAKIGILLMLGNFTSILLTSMDRWFVKGLLTTLDFALYSFAVSIEGFLNVAITPITVTLYNYFCKNKSPNNIKQLFGAIEIFSVFLVSCAFPAKFIMEVFLPKYIDSSRIMFILFGAQVLYIIIKAVFVNLYKARGQQRVYFLKLTSVIIIGFVLNWVCYSVYPHRESFAIGTLLSSIYWFFVCIPDFKDLYFSIIDYLFPLVSVVIFIFYGLYFDALIGFCFYIATLVLITLLMRRRYLKYLIQLLPAKLRDRIKI